MVTTLRLRMPLHSDETFSSFVEGLAMRNLQPSVRNFCADFRLSFRDVCVGEDRAVAKIAQLSGIDEASLSKAVFKRQADRSYRLLGQHFGVPLLLPNTCQYCPACILEDMELDLSRPALGPYGRRVWRMRPYRTCHHHGIELQRIECGRGYGSHSLREIVAPLLSSMATIGQAALRRPATPLEVYIAQRLAGEAGPAWLDELGFTVAVRLVELVGTVELFGPAARHWEHTEEQFRQAGKVGFEIVRHGPDAFRSFLSKLQATVEDRDSRDRGGKEFGLIYDWLWDNKHPETQPVRDLVCDHLENTTAIAAGRKILRRVVAERKLHSVWSASLEHGIHVKALRAQLVGARIVEDKPEAFDNHLLFPAKPHQLLLERLGRGITALYARQRIGCERQVFKPIVAAGLIKPIVESDKVIPMFDPVDLDHFVERLTRSAVTYAEKPAHLSSIASAAKRASCSQPEIASLILEGKLKTVGRLPNVDAFSSLLVDHAEVIPLVQFEEELGGIVVSDICDDFGIPHAAVVKLVDDKVLPSAERRHPRKRRFQRIVLHADYVAFKAKFVSLRDVAKEAGVHGRSMRTQLSKLGIEPYPDLGDKAFMYDRTKMPN